MNVPKQDRGLFAPEQRHEVAIAKALQGVAFDIAFSESDPVTATVTTQTTPPFAMAWAFSADASREQVVEQWDKFVERFGRGVELTADAYELAEASKRARRDDVREREPEQASTADREHAHTQAATLEHAHDAKRKGGK
jgi:hypothetical protein